MGDLDISTATKSNMTARVEGIEVDLVSTDGVLDQEETFYYQTDWTKYFGYFNNVPDLKSALLMKAIWDVGKGYKTDTKTEAILDNIQGWGKDTFDDILFNMVVTSRIGGDAFAEIIRNDKGSLVNLKPLDPQNIKIVVGRNGMVKRYEQITKSNNGELVSWAPNKIFHLCNNRMADQIHGISDIQAMEKTILAEYENFDDMKTIMHRQARPMIMFKIGTDNQGKINAFVKKMDEAVNKGENIYIPDDVNAVSYEVIQVNVSQIIMEWRNDIRNKFYRTIGLPQIVPGAGGQGTESESKVIYLAFEQIVERDQRQLEKQLWGQLAIKIDLTPPASISNDLNQDASKDADNAIAFQNGETTAGKG